MKKLIYTLVFMLLFVPFTVHAGVIDGIAAGLTNLNLFSDVPNDHHNVLAISWMADEGSVEGYPDGTFKPDNGVNRAELMKMVVASAPPIDLAEYGNCFPDVTDEWFATYVCYAKEAGWVEGYPDGTFKPGDMVNRVEAIKIILNAIVPAEDWPEPTEADMSIAMPSDLDMNAWYGGYLRFAIVKELVDGWHVTQNEDGSLNYFPDGDFTRKEVAEMLFRVMVYLVERVEYPRVMAEAICYMAENQSTLSEADLKAGMVDIFELNGYGEAEMDALTVKYENDQVVQDRISAETFEICGVE